MPKVTADIPERSFPFVPRLLWTDLPSVATEETTGEIPPWSLPGSHTFGHPRVLHMFSERAQCEVLLCHQWCAWPKVLPTAR